MTREMFEAQVGRLSARAAQNPDAFVLRVRLILAVGYGYLLLVLALTVGLLVLVMWAMLSGRLNPGLGVTKLVVVIVPLAYAILRSLWVHFPPPEGLPLHRDVAPKLHALVDQLARAMKVPTPERILLDGDLNAGASQPPRFGLLGGSRNTLMVGLPLLHALTYHQFRAVLAHELGHLAGSHGRFAASILRVSQSWQQLLERVRGRGVGGVVFGRFAGWYAPQLEAHAYVLYQAQEAEADRQAARHAGQRVAATALATLSVVGSYLEESFWPSIWKLSETDAEPPSDAYERLLRALGCGAFQDGARGWLRSALTQRTDYTDTHPALTDRLAALGVRLTEDDVGACLGAWASPELGPDGRASDIILGQSLSLLTSSLSARWRGRALTVWALKGDKARGLRDRLAALEAKLASGTATGGELWERAQVGCALHGSEGAEPLLRDVLLHSPRHPEANLVLGDLLLGRGDENGLRCIEHALQDPDLLLVGCDRAIDYLRERGREFEARRYLRMGDSHMALLRAASAERSSVSRDDILVPCPGGLELLSSVRVQIARIPEVGEAFLVRRQVRHLPQKPCYILMVVPSSPWARVLGSGIAGLLDKVVSSVSSHEGLLVVVATSGTSWLLSKLKGIPGSRIYRRGG